MSSASSFYELSSKNTDGVEISMAKFTGRVCLVVNLNYTQLVELDRRYRDRGLQILLYPCNQFANQEPGTNDEILAFARSYGVTFPVMEKGDVNGSKTQPVFKYLKSKLRGTFTSTIKWNYTKFLIDRNGQPYKRFGTFTPPIKLIDDILDLLDEETRPTSACD
ncbi:hypothetical protein SDRG_15909 [Saprolegnia diclina VS20]|uniref:Glutathione peroxidase n=1 Tax=Saprolegnia diclina (strain VS20) TaxID=1156394 RepID=T0R2J5_SAPDV|nr:hypothetical protein SDRG_15909 [Saprolegnia diclina VS20]EQC26248.1 hypothetical protein SDRG_15909 [Saprolegnia diclina VS20]|eukprot:XP_008620317.1 hypothetical protein SDRG_15909 [Saprolegnia diclina VS20]